MKYLGAWLVLLSCLLLPSMLVAEEGTEEEPDDTSTGDDDEQEAEAPDEPVDADGDGVDDALERVVEEAVEDVIGAEVEEALDEALDEAVDDEVQEVLDEILDEAVEQAVEQLDRGDGDEGSRTIIGFRSNSDRELEINVEVAVASTWYDRGEVMSSAKHRPVFRPTLAVSFDFGAYLALETAHVLPEREVEVAGDEVAFTLGYNNHNRWLDVDAGLTASFYPGGDRVAGNAEVYLGVGTGDFLPIVSPSFRNYFTFAGQDAEGEDEPLGWFGETRLDAHHEFGKGHSITGGVAFGMSHFGDDGFEAVDLVVSAYYSFELPFGLYLSPGLTYAHIFKPKDDLLFGTLRVGVTF